MFYVQVLVDYGVMQIRDPDRVVGAKGGALLRGARKPFDTSLAPFEFLPFLILSSLEPVMLPIPFLNPGQAPPRVSSLVYLVKTLTLTLELLVVSSESVVASEPPPELVEPCARAPGTTRTRLVSTLSKPPFLRLAALGDLNVVLQRHSQSLTHFRFECAF